MIPGDAPVSATPVSDELHVTPSGVTPPTAAQILPALEQLRMPDWNRKYV